MRPLTLILSLLIAPAAHADLSDSGNLSIGGEGVIAGTMTVQGNAFSVGGSNFSVSAGTVQVGGLLKASGQGIQWADGSVSTTATAGGSGDISASGANIVSGSIDMISGSTFTISTSAHTNLPVGVLFSSGTTQPISFTLYAKRDYTVMFDITFTSGSNAGNPAALCRINNDVTASYAIEASDYPYPGHNINSSVTYFPLTMNSGGAVQTNDIADSEWHFGSTDSSYLRIKLGQITDTYGGTATREMAPVSGWYNGSASPWVFICTPNATLGWTYRLTIMQAPQ